MGCQPGEQPPWPRRHCGEQHPRALSRRRRSSRSTRRLGTLARQPCLQVWTPGWSVCLRGCVHGGVQHSSLRAGDPGCQQSRALTAELLSNGPGVGCNFSSSTHRHSRLDATRTFPGFVFCFDHDGWIPNLAVIASRGNGPVAARSVRSRHALRLSPARPPAHSIPHSLAHVNGHDTWSSHLALVR